MGIEILTFGCRLNTYESQVMRDHAAAAGHDDVTIVNTCAVTSEAVAQARQSIRRAAREHPGRPIIVTGCAAQIDPQAFAAMPEVAHIVGNDDKMKAATWASLLAPDAGRIVLTDIMEVRETAGHLVSGIDGRVRAFVEVQNGCDHRCTFCIIPYGRGNSRSVPMGLVVDQVKALVDSGIQEAVITGVDITSYGRDLPGTPSLGILVQAILRHVPDLPRLRLSSIDQVEADAALMDALESDTRFMPHLHLSLQAGDDMILKRMKRRHCRDDAIRFCADARRRRPDVVFGADIIAGFPTETDEMFERSLDLISACGLTHVHVFPFSPRKGTPAARMPAVPRPAIKERASRLRMAGRAALSRHLQGLVGTRQNVLIENRGVGHTEGFAPVRAHGLPPGRIVPMVIESVSDTMLSGRAA